MIYVILRFKIFFQPANATLTLDAAVSTWNFTVCPAEVLGECVSNVDTTRGADIVTTARRDTIGTPPKPSPIARRAKVLNSIGFKTGGRFYWQFNNFL